MEIFYYNERDNRNRLVNVTYQNSKNPEENYDFLGHVVAMAMKEHSDGTIWDNDLHTDSRIRNLAKFVQVMFNHLEFDKQIEIINDVDNFDVFQ